MNPNIENIVRELIDNSIHMSLATVSENKPWVCEVHFVYDEGLNLYWRSLPSRRHSKELMKNPYVAGNIVKQHSLEEYPSAIYFEGTGEVIDDDKEIKKLFPLFAKRLGAKPEIIDETKTAEGHKFYKVTVSTWYAFGKFGSDKGAKHTLQWHGNSK